MVIWLPAPNSPVGVCMLLITHQMLWIHEWDIHTYAALYLICLKQSHGWELSNLHMATLPFAILELLLTKTYSPSWPPWTQACNHCGLWHQTHILAMSLSSCSALLRLAPSPPQQWWSPLPYVPCLRTLKSHLFLSAQPLATCNFIYQLEPAGGMDCENLTCRCANSLVLWKPSYHNINNKPNPHLTLFVH